MSEFLNIKESPFNAVGNGIADDTTAVRAFFVAIAGTVGYVPAGDYLTNDFTVYSNTRVFGDGPGVSRFVAINHPSMPVQVLSGDTPLITNAAPGTDTNIVFENIGVDGTNLPTGIWILNVHSGGTGYVVGDTGTVNTGGSTCHYTVATVSGGVCLTLTITAHGTGYTAQGAVSVATTNGGGQPGVGTGLTVDYATRADAVVSFIKTTDTLLQNFCLSNTVYLGLNFSGGENPRVINSVFHDVSDSIRIASWTDGMTSVPIYDAKVIGCSFRDNRSSCVAIGGLPSALVYGTIISNNTAHDTGENFVYANRYNVNTQVIGNNVRSITRNVDNGTCIEMQGAGLVICNNILADIAWTGILLFAPNNAVISNNWIWNPGLEDSPMEPGNDPSACIKIYALGTDGSDRYDQSKGLTISGNTCGNSNGNVNAIVFQGAPDSEQMTAVSVGGNTTAGSAWLEGPLVVRKADIYNKHLSSMWGADCVVCGNSGFDDSRQGRDFPLG